MHRKRWQKVSDVGFVINANVRFYRNVRDVMFVGKATAEDAADVNMNVKAVSDNIWGEGKYDILNINSAEECDVLYWGDVNCCLVDAKKTEYERMAFTNQRKNISIVTNESEHILVQAIDESGDVSKAYKNAAETVNALCERIPFAASDELGFLTANPNVVGAGLRVGVLMNIPGLVITRKLAPLAEALEKDGIEMRPFYVEKRLSFGSFYHITNKYTLGITEDEITESVSAAVKKISAEEAECRATLMASSRVIIDNVVWKALGDVAVSRVLERGNFVDDISNIRFGVEQGIFDIDIETVDEMFIKGQPGYIERYKKLNSLDTMTQNALRARILREIADPILKRLL